jgi:dihydrodiol dehydrogenase / D-xylose 1-dehydrogenase (NADP)
VRWGILSAGKISSDYAKAIAITDGAFVGAVAARSSDKAEEFANLHGIPKSYGSYSELLVDPDIDVVYVGSIADHHYALAAQSLKAGKPTVVEKPLTLSYKDTKSLVQLAKKRDVFLMYVTVDMGFWFGCMPFFTHFLVVLFREGMWTRCFPAMSKVSELIASGAIGNPSVVQADFGWSTANCGPEDRIWKPESGGMTLDIGMYMAQLGQVAFSNSTVTQIQSMGTKKNGVDHTVLANIQYTSPDDDRTGMLQFYVTGEANTEERVVIQGTSGRISIDPAAHVPTVVRLLRNEGRGIAKEQVFRYRLPNDSYTSWNYPGSIGFTYQVQAVGEALRNGKKECHHFTLKDSLQVAAMLDTILQQIHDDTNSQESREDCSTVLSA